MPLPTPQKQLNRWSRAENINYISKEEWPPASSPDLNPVDFSVWGTLQTRARTKSHKSVKTLSNELKQWQKIPQQELRDSIQQFKGRLKAVAKNRGYIE